MDETKADLFCVKDDVVMVKMIASRVALLTLGCLNNINKYNSSHVKLCLYLDLVHMLSLGCIILLVF